MGRGAGDDVEPGSFQNAFHDPDVCRELLTDVGFEAGAGEVFSFGATGSVGPSPQVRFGGGRLKAEDDVPQVEGAARAEYPGCVGECPLFPESTPSACARQSTTCPTASRPCSPGKSSAAPSSPAGRGGAWPAPARYTDALNCSFSTNRRPRWAPVASTRSMQGSAGTLSSSNDTGSMTWRGVVLRCLAQDLGHLLLRQLTVHQGGTAGDLLKEDLVRDRGQIAEEWVVVVGAFAEPGVKLAAIRRSG